MTSVEFPPIAIVNFYKFLYKEIYCRIFWNNFKQSKEREFSTFFSKKVSLLILFVSFLFIYYYQS